MTRRSRFRFRVGILGALLLPLAAVVLTGSFRAEAQPGKQIPRPPIFRPPQMPQMPQMPKIETVWKCIHCNTVVGTGPFRPNLTECPNPNCPSRLNRPGGQMVQPPPPVAPPPAPAPAPDNVGNAPAVPPQQPVAAPPVPIHAVEAPDIGPGNVRLPSSGNWEVCVGVFGMVVVVAGTALLGVWKMSP
jgi:hypothetical protein